MKFNKKDVLVKKLTPEEQKKYDYYFYNYPPPIYTFNSPKQKIQSMNFNVTSFVTTQANDKILNKLAGDDGQVSITVEISKESASVPVTITIGKTSR